MPMGTRGRVRLFYAVQTHDTPLFDHAVPVDVLLFFSWVFRFLGWPGDHGRGG